MDGRPRAPYALPRRRFRDLLSRQYRWRRGLSAPRANPRRRRRSLCDGDSTDVRLRGVLPEGPGSRTPGARARRSGGRADRGSSSLLQRQRVRKDRGLGEGRGRGASTSLHEYRSRLGACRSSGARRPGIGARHRTPAARDLDRERQEALHRARSECPRSRVDRTDVVCGLSRGHCPQPLAARLRPPKGWSQA